MSFIHASRVAIASGAVAILVTAAPSNAATDSTTARANVEAPQTATTAQQDAVRDLLSAMNGTEIGPLVTRTAFNAVANTLASRNPELSPRVLEIAREAVDAVYGVAYADIDSHARLLAPVYLEHFTLDEIRGLTDFYRSPLGRKTIEKLPAVYEQSIEVSTRWAASLEPQLQSELTERLAAEGYDITF